MLNLKGSRTEKNLLAAFAGESIARNRYDFFASKAKKEGYVQISAIFEETADQERSHAKNFYKFLEGGDVELKVVFPAGIIARTSENLKSSAQAEKEEWSVLYPEYARIAADEGFEEIAELFRAVAVAEKQHEKRFRGLLKNLESATTFKKDRSIIWQCRKCGYLHEGKEAPDICPACSHSQAYFEMLAENW